MLFVYLYLAFIKLFIVNPTQSIAKNQFFMNNQSSQIQQKQNTQSKKQKTSIKTIINGYILSGEYLQQSRTVVFKMTSSVDKNEKYEIQFADTSLAQTIKQYFQNVYALFVYLAHSTKNKLKITNDKILIIQLEKDKKKQTVSYSLVQSNQNESNKVQQLKQQQVKQQVKKQQIERQQQTQNLQKIQSNHDENKLLQSEQSYPIDQKTVDIQQVAQNNSQTIEQAKQEQNQIVEQKQIVQITTDLIFVKLTGQQQTLLQFSVNCKIEPLTKLIQQNSLVNIEELILKRFNITQIPPFNQLSLVVLKNLVLEDNKIAKIQNLQTCSNLQKLNLDSNKICIIQNLGSLTSLKFLKLGNNQIDAIEGLDKLKNLETLWLDFNNITKIENLQKLGSLKSLNLSFNQIEKIQNLEGLKQLWELMISNNQLTHISNLDSNVKIGRLALNSNMIQHISGLRKLLLLQNLHLIGNQISTFDKRQFEQVNWLKMLKELKLNGNGIVVNQQNKEYIQRLRKYGIKVYV